MSRTDSGAWTTLLQGAEGDVEYKYIVLTDPQPEVPRFCIYYVHLCMYIRIRAYIIRNKFLTHAGTKDEVSLTGAVHAMTVLYTKKTYPGVLLPGELAALAMHPSLAHARLFCGNCPIIGLE